MAKTTAKKEKKKKYERPKRGNDTFMIDFENVGIKPNFNERIDYGDIEELAQSIQENGIRVPLRGHYDKLEDKWLITSGHRRLKAIQELDKKGIKIVVPIISDVRESDEQRVLGMITDNSGKKFNPVEEAAVIHRLIVDHNYTEEQIRDKTGFTKVYICNLKLLIKAPKKVKDLIVNNTLSATLAMKIFREEKDYEKAQEIIEKTIISKGTDEEGKKKKITEKDLNKHKGKTNSYSALKKVFKKFNKNELTPRQDKIDLFNFAKSINDGEVSLDNIIAELFEPVPDKDGVDKNQTDILSEIESNNQEHVEN
jgi:ParB family chromosome partitioning protein